MLTAFRIFQYFVVTSICLRPLRIFSARLNNLFAGLNNEFWV